MAEYDYQQDDEEYLILFNKSQTQKVNFQLNEVCFQDKKVCLYDGMTNQLASLQDQQKVSFFLFESYLLVVSEVYSTHNYGIIHRLCMKSLSSMG